jgi:hypothetical protein
MSFFYNHPTGAALPINAEGRRNDAVPQAVQP